MNQAKSHADKDFSAIGLTEFKYFLSSKPPDIKLVAIYFTSFRNERSFSAKFCRLAVLLVCQIVLNIGRKLTGSLTSKQYLTYCQDSKIM